MFPVYQVGCSAQCPLMTTQTSETCMMPFVQQPIQIKRPIMIIRHAIAGKQMFFYRFKILHMSSTLNRRIIIFYNLCKRRYRN